MGFSKGTVSFFRSLKRNNDKVWFDARKEIYERDVVAPSRAFVVALGEKLRKIAPDIHADPRVNRSLFRIHRDIRFSADKSPYKTHLGLWMWEGARPRMECSGFYFQLDPPEVMFACGIHIFPPAILDTFRRVVADPKRAADLETAIRKVEKSGCAVGGDATVRVPRGFDPHGQYAHFAKYKGLFAAVNEKIPDEFYTPAFVDYAFKRYKSMLPLHQWLKDMVDDA
ncbi:MAG: DUF2461 domain-containing protein [Deltaproteobacteria bacterium]|nr:DUF2461 domain-containing protein [Deltaproteobacteria bacterium]